MTGYNFFSHSSTGEAPYYLMLGYDTFMPTLFTLLLQKESGIWERKDAKFNWMQ